MDIREATSRYETWLGRFMPLVRADVDEKHRRMQLAPFPFLRATFYRWCQLWRGAAGDLGRAARVLSVGDLHIENFGTWRDADGRLIWGINDFDEATVLPWTQDLVRLAVSVHVAIESEHLCLRRRNACAAILDGYRSGLESGGRPFVLEEQHGWLRQVATTELRDATLFWQRFEALPTARTVDPGAAAAIVEAMPARGLPIRFARRVAGMGSLGRPRVVGIADWSGGMIAREAKAMAPSAWLWAAGHGDETPVVRYDEIVSRAVRVKDPTVHLAGAWLVRRLAPQCTRIELADLPDGHDEERLLHAMGFETANVHLGTPGAARAIRKQLRARTGPWLHETAKAFGAEIARDWRHWRKAAA